MLSYAHGACDAASCWRDDRRQPRADDRAACRAPRRSCPATQGVRYTYAELGEAVDRLARGLLAAGPAQGDRVGVWSPNRAEWALVQYATAKLGVILVNINPAYRTSASSSTRSASRAAGGSIAAPELQGLGLPGDGRRGPRPAARARAMRSSSKRRVGRARRRPAPSDRRGPRPRWPTLDFDDPINIQYTSGTTGFPKGATLTHHNILNNGFFVGECCRYTEADRVCIPVPFYHCFGMVMGNLGATTHGATMVIPAEAFEPEATLDACAEERCTTLYGVPTMFIAELGAPGLRQLRSRLAADRDHGRLAVPGRGDEAGHRARCTSTRSAIAYGMTETSPVIDPGAHRRPARAPRRDRRPGRCRTSRSRSSTRRHGRIRAARRAAASSARAATCVMRGYWNDPERTAEAIDAARLDAHRRPGDDGRATATSTSSAGSRTW